MPSQTKMNGRSVAQSPAAGVGRNLAGLNHDLITLGELQAQLLAVDLRDAGSASLLPVILLTLALLIALGTMPVVLLGIGWVLVNVAGLGEGAAFLVVSAVALGTVAALSWWSWRELSAAVGILKRSQQELKENVRWIKQVLLKPNTQQELYRQRV